MNKDITEIVEIFPIPIYFTKTFTDYSKEIKFLENASMMDHSTVSDDYGTISKDTYILNNPELKEFKKYINYHLNVYAREKLGYIFDKIAITQSWVTQKENGEKHKFHFHPNSFISGCFYWQKRPFQEITFKRPFKFTNLDIKKDLQAVIKNNYIYELNKFSPEENTLMLFPSTLEHGVERNSYTEKRKCLAFNTVILGTIGIESNLTELDFNKLDLQDD